MTTQTLSGDVRGYASFEPWPKIARLNRPMIITEKIDGTNAAVNITAVPAGETYPISDALIEIVENPDGGVFLVHAQSRNRLIYPGQDNAGFAAWVKANAHLLALTLGPGRHFGEWWGSGIQRGYGLPKGEKRFSLFNVSRYSDFDLTALPEVSTVPVLYKGPFLTVLVASVIDDLRRFGSHAAPGFMKPEGVIVFHTAANLPFKVTLEGDEAPKGAQR